MAVTSNYEAPVKTIMDNKNAKLVIKSMLTGKIVVFPAFLTTFNQTFTSTWNEEDVYGRMDSIATFQNTKRQISLGFDLPAATFVVAQDNLENCDMLAQFLYPGYTKQSDGIGQVISRPPLVSVKFANLVSSGGGDASKQQSGGALGYLSGLEWSPILDMGMFTDESGKLYPKVISLSFTLTVLHQGVKGFGDNNKFLSNGFFNP